MECGLWAVATMGRDMNDGHRNGRQDRLKAALRDNLKRRKVQARARAEAPEGEAGDLSAATSPEDDARPAEAGTATEPKPSGGP